MPTKSRILFFSEAMTLAHKVRPVVLGRVLDAQSYEVFLASAPYFESLLQEDIEAGAIHSLFLDSCSPEEYAKRLSGGKPLFDEARLQSYVEADRKLIGSIRPTLVVGDMRLSLLISARVEKIPYLNITNAHWSPYAYRPFKVPDLSLLRWLGVPVCEVLFQRLRPFLFALHAKPINRCLQHYGLNPLGRDLGRCYTEADYTLYADTPELVPTHGLPRHHLYLGPVLWSPKVPMPRIPMAAKKERAWIYWNLGSSGNDAITRQVLFALSSLPTVIIAGARDRQSWEKMPSNVILSEYLPGEKVAKKASLVICNGGSASAYQALASGTPVLGICSNLDQILTMEHISARGAGKWLRASKATPKRVRSYVQMMLGHSHYQENAKKIAQEFSQYDAGRRFQQLVTELVSTASEMRPFRQAA